MDQNTEFYVYIDNLNIHTKDSAILKNISFTMDQGDSLSIIGPSGSGKTTLIKALLNLLPSDFRITGTIEINDNQTTAFSRGQRGYVPQNLALWPHLDVLNTIRLSLKFSRGDGRFAEELVESLGLKGWLKNLSTSLSGGQKQRLALLRALVPKPQILILDEPFSSLDIVAKRELIELLQSFRKKFILTTIFISHDLAEAKAMGRKMMIIKDGRSLWFGDTTMLNADAFPHDWNPTVSLKLSEQIDQEKVN